MSQKEIEESLTLLEKDWDIDPILRDFVLGKRSDIADHTVKVTDVIFHIPFLINEKNLSCGNVTGRIVIIVVIDMADFL